MVSTDREQSPETPKDDRRPAGSTDELQIHRTLRQEMVRRQLEERDITDPAVLAAMGRVLRHRFVPEHHRTSAYADGPLPIGEGQTISQPYVVALTLQLARAAEGKRALDIGTGSGYQAAVLAEIVEHVYGIEIREELAHTAEARLRELGYRNVTVRQGDGYEGWPDRAPFDLIVGAAAATEVPSTLVEQLDVEGRLVMPIGSPWQELTVVEKGRNGELRRWTAGDVRFVPMIRSEELRR
jgi:protein-L-isoaspartate(D-aspartate) O-methyltransferase